MSVRKWASAVATLVVAGGILWTATRRVVSSSHTASIVSPAASHDSLLTEGEIRDRDITFFERRVAEDPMGASDRSLLATLYMDRARASGTFGDYKRAEMLARRSLALRTEHNTQTFGILASALLASHDFNGALAVAKRADSLDPGDAGHVALLGEIELELGDYAAASDRFASLHFDADQFTVAARVARWRELTGNVDAARRLLRAAAKRVANRDDLPREQVAWFQYRLGELELRLGRLDSAEAAYRRGLAIFPEDYRILGGLARVRAARHDWHGAIDAGSQAIATQLDPATLGTISDAYAALGDTASAAQYARAMTKSALEQPGPIHRAWGLFVLDHGGPRDVRRVLTKTRTELRTRHDVYGFDLLAWGLHKQGRDGEAMRAMQRALAQHTQDAQLFRHAAEIERSLGDAAAADGYLDEARTLSGGGPTVMTVSR